MKPPPLISVCFFGCRAASTGGISDDIGGFTGHLRQPFGLLRAAGQLRMPIPQRNNCAKHLDEFGLIMMLSEAACPDQARKKTQYFYVMVDGVEILRETKYFLGKYEIEIDDAGNERKLHYISAGDGVFAIVEKVNQADAQIHYIHKNYLGSYDAITNHLGVVEERLSFDPWGRRRNPSTGIVDDGIYSMFDRGFTGHQHLDEFGLINMNGRLYDPVLARFLSPDPFVQAPDNLQNHNRYSYALNNPLRYTDPSGEFFFFALLPGIGVFLDAMCWGAVIGGSIGGVRGSMTPGMTIWDGAWRGAVVGAFGGLFGPMGGAGMSFIENLGIGAIQGGFTGSLDAALWGTDVGKGMMWGAAGGMAFATLTSQNLKNAVRGKGFKTNANVYESFKAGKYSIPEGSTWQQEVLDYFGFEGKYDPLRKNPGATNRDGTIVYNDVAFEKNYDYLKFISSEEKFHQLDLFSGDYDEVNWSDPVDFFINHGKGEWKAKLYQYKQQGLFPNSGEDITTDIISFGIQAGYYDHQDNLFTERWWHFLYKIPRRF